MVRKASDKTLWAMNVNQIEDRIDRLQKEAGHVFRGIQGCKRQKAEGTAKCRNLRQRRDKVSSELKRTTDIAKITRHYARLKGRRNR